MVQPFVGSVGARVLRQVAPNIERAVWRRTIFSGSRQSTPPQAALRIAQYSASRPTTANILSRFRKPSPRTTRRPFHRTSRLRDANPAPKDTPAQEPQGITARLRKLSREYGWAALGVYLGLTVLDFPFCFLLVRSVGTDRIGAIEHYVVSHVSKVIPQSVRDWWHEYRGALKDAEKENIGNDDISEHVEMAGWGVEEAERRHKAEASKFYRHILSIHDVIHAHMTSRSRHPVSSSLCCTQELHLPPSPPDSRNYAQGSQSSQVLGLEYWKASE